MDNYKYKKYKNKYIDLKNNNNQDGGIITIRHGFYIFFYSKYRLELVDKKRFFNITNVKKNQTYEGTTSKYIKENKPLSWFDLMNNMDPLMIFTRMDKLYLDDNNISLCENEMLKIKDKYISLNIYNTINSNSNQDCNNVTYIDEINEELKNNNLDKIPNEINEIDKIIEHLLKQNIKQESELQKKVNILKNIQYYDNQCKKLENTINEKHICEKKVEKKNENKYINLYEFSESFTSSLRKMLDNSKVLNTVFNLLHKMNISDKLKKYTACDILNVLNMMIEFCDVYTGSDMEELVEYMFTISEKKKILIDKIIENSERIKYIKLIKNNNNISNNKDKINIILNKIINTLNHKGLQYDSVLIYEINRLGKNEVIYSYTNDVIYNLYKKFNDKSKPDTELILTIDEESNLDDDNQTGGMDAISIAIKIVKICIFLYVTFKFINAIIQIKIFMEDIDKNNINKYMHYINENEKLKKEIDDLKKIKK